MFIWKDGFRFTEKSLQITPEFEKFLREHNAYNKRNYISFVLENIEIEYGKLLKVKEGEELSVKEVFSRLNKAFSKKNAEDYNPFVLTFLELLAESIPEEATDNKVA